uniref:Coiled-coil-helix-coiled-coil-helix domain containing 2 n=1 Tax=Oreochromis aureus TaxID=47969 RepID=A0A668U658_OREAU
CIQEGLSAILQAVGVVNNTWYGPPSEASASSLRPLLARPAAALRQPGMFAQMASTATGVAVGSGVGATITQTMTGGLGGGHTEPARPDITYQVSPALASHRTGTACSEEMRSFLACAINTSDLKVCEGVNEALKKCIFANGK